MNNHMNANCKWLHPTEPKPKTKLHCTWCNKKNHNEDTCWSKPKKSSEWIEVGAKHTDEHAAGKVKSLAAEKGVVTDNVFLSLIDLEMQTSQPVEPVEPTPHEESTIETQMSSNSKGAATTYQCSRTDHQKDMSFKEILMNEDIECNCEGLIDKSLFLMQRGTETSSSGFVTVNHKERGEVGAATGGLFTSCSLWLTWLYGILEVFGEGKLPHLKNLIVKHKISLVDLVEVKNNAAKIREVADLNMQCCFASIQSPKIWFLWNENIDCRDFICHPQCVTCKVQQGSRHFQLSVVYANTDQVVRGELWNHLVLQVTPDELWMVGGDFNTVMNADEKHGATSFNRKSAMEFRLFEDSVAVQDMGFSGSKFQQPGKHGLGQARPHPG